MSDILDELTRDIKEERVQKIFMNILPKVMYFTLFILLLMFVKNWLDNRKLDADMKIGDLFHKSLLLAQNDQDALFKESFDHLLEIANHPQKDLIELHQVKILLNNSDFIQSQEKLERIFESSNYQELTRAYSRLLWSLIELDKSSSKTPIEKVEKNFALSAAKGSVFYGNGSLIYSLWLIKNKRGDEAKSILESLLQSADIPSSLMSFASAILSNISS